MVVDYDFCLNSKLTPSDLLTWLDLDDVMDYSYSSDGLYSKYGAFFNRNLMIVDDAIRVSVDINSFDKWSNSEEYWFDLKNRSDYRSFIRFVMEQRNEY